MSADPFNVFDPRIQRMTQILHPISLDAFESLLYEDIDTAVIEFTSGLSTTKTYYQEDEISRFICTFLKGRFYKADTGVYRNGETDICVKDDLGKYEIVCEAKKFDMNKLTDGAYQLITRYCRGHKNQSGIMLVYIDEDMATPDCMSLWCQYTIQQSSIDQKYLADLNFSNCTSNDECKVSIHKHAVSKRSFKVRHIPVNYYFAPQEKIRPKQGRDGRKDALAAIQEAREVKEYRADNEERQIE